MANADIAMSLPRLSGEGRKNSFLKSFMHRLIAARMARASFDALQSLSDPMLRDIGINRYDIRAIAEGHAQDYLKRHGL